MSLETGNYISDLVATNPTGTDPKSQGDDHLRLVKDVLKKSFPLVNGVHTAAMVPFVPAGSIAATNVQAAIAEIETDAAPQGTNILGSIKLPGGGLICWHVVTPDPDGNAGITFHRAFQSNPAVTVSAYGGASLTPNDSLWAGNCNSLSPTGCQVSGRYHPTGGGSPIPTTLPIHVIAIGLSA